MITFERFEDALQTRACQASGKHYRDYQVGYLLSMVQTNISWERATVDLERTIFNHPQPSEQDLIDLLSKKVDKI
jgi:hypothetical protein